SASSDMGFRVVLLPDNSSDADRRAAEWALGLGGVVKINGGQTDIKTGAELPRGAFQLTLVYLRNNKKLHDAGLANLKNCQNLAWLDLSNTDVGNAGLAQLKDCRKLTALVLDSTDLDDSAVGVLSAFPNLTQLHLTDTKFTQAGIEALHKA